MLVLLNSLTFSISQSQRLFINFPARSVQKYQLPGSPVLCTHVSHTCAHTHTHAHTHEVTVMREKMEGQGIGELPGLLGIVYIWT